MYVHFICTYVIVIFKYTLCRDVMTLPNLKQYIYSAVGGDEMGGVEGRLNIMQTTFLTLQISPDLQQDEDAVSKGQHVFRTLFTRHFDDTMEVRGGLLCSLYIHTYVLSYICTYDITIVCELVLSVVYIYVHGFIYIHL